MIPQKPELSSNLGTKPGKKEKAVKLSEDQRMKQILTSKMKEMETEFDVGEHVVIDMGNAITKIGIAGKDLPKIKIPSITGKFEAIGEEEKKDDIEYNQQADLYGKDPFHSELYLNENDKYKIKIKHLTPGDHQLETSPEFCEFLRDALENKMQILPTDYDVIVNTSPIINKKNIEAYANMFLTNLGFKAMAIINSASLSLFSTGRTSGLSVMCGETRTYTVPIYEGFPLYHALNKNKLGGRDLTKFFEACVVKEKLDVKQNDILTLRKIKKQTCAVPYLHPYQYYLDEKNEDIIPEAKMLYRLPDGKTIVPIPRKYRILASEVLFNPEVMNDPLFNDEDTKGILVNSISNIKNEKEPKQTRGLPSLIVSSLKKAEGSFDDIRLLTDNIVLSGGTTMINGFGERVKKELIEYKDDTSCYALNYTPQIITENNRYISKWIGMSMIASMSAFDKLFIKKTDYNDEDIFEIMKKIF